MGKFSVKNVILGFWVAACPLLANANELQKTVNEYFEVYQAREDFDKFMSFYHEKVKFEDLVFGHAANNKSELTAFFDWGQGAFTVLKDKPLMDIQSQVLDGNVVVTRGIFNRFEFNGQNMGPWRFVMWHHFEESKIVYQEDWINYTPRKQFSGGRSLNPKP